MKSLLNRKAVKEYALECSEVREKDFTRVSKDFIDALEYRIKELVRDSVRNHPTKGKTIIQIR